MFMESQSTELGWPMGNMSHGLSWGQVKEGQEVNKRKDSVCGGAVGRVHMCVCEAVDMSAGGHPYTECACVGMSQKSGFVQASPTNVRSCLNHPLHVPSPRQVLQNPKGNLFSLSVVSSFSVTFKEGMLRDEGLKTVWDVHTVGSKHS